MTKKKTSAKPPAPIPLVNAGEFLALENAWLKYQLADTRFRQAQTELREADQRMSEAVAHARTQQDIPDDWTLNPQTMEWVPPNQGA